MTVIACEHIIEHISGPEPKIWYLKKFHLCQIVLYKRTVKAIVVFIVVIETKKLYEWSGIFYIFFKWSNLVFYWRILFPLWASLFLSLFLFKYWYLLRRTFPCNRKVSEENGSCIMPNCREGKRKYMSQTRWSFFKYFRSSDVVV